MQNQYGNTTQYQDNEMQFFLSICRSVAINIIQKATLLWGNACGSQNLLDQSIPEFLPILLEAMANFIMHTKTLVVRNLGYECSAILTG
jgi:hypothetical protein